MTRPAKISMDEFSRRMRQVFRSHGFDGASMRELADSVGMSKAALYHFFPNGKSEMASAVLDDLKLWVSNYIIQPLHGKGNPRQRLERLCEALAQLYEAGKQPCLIGLFSNGEALSLFQARIQASFRTLIQNVALVLTDAGLSQEEADQRAEDLIIRIQGALVLARALDDIGPFSRLQHRIVDELLKGTNFENAPPLTRRNVR